MLSVNYPAMHTFLPNNYNVCIVVKEKTTICIMKTLQRASYLKVLLQKNRNIVILPETNRYYDRNLNRC